MACHPANIASLQVPDTRFQTNWSSWATHVFTLPLARGSERRYRDTIGLGSATRHHEFIYSPSAPAPLLFSSALGER